MCVLDSSLFFHGMDIVQGFCYLSQNFSLKPFKICEISQENTKQFFILSHDCFYSTLC